MSSKVQGGATPNVTGQGIPEPAPRDLQTQLETGGAPVVGQTGQPLVPGEPRRVQGNAEVDDLLNRAGLSQSASGVDVKDVSALNALHGAQAAAELTGPNGTKIAAPTPPRIELNDELRVGAETFVANVDQVVNDLFTKGGANVANSVPLANENSQLFDGLNQLFFAGQLLNGGAVRAEAEAALAESQDGISRDNAGYGTAPASAPVRTLDQNASSQQAFAGLYPQLAGEGGILAGANPTPLDPMSGMPLTSQNLSSQQVFSEQNFKDMFAGAILRTNQTEGVVGAGPGASPVEGVSDAQIRQIAELSADALLALFLKLNIIDPNNSTETHNKLHELSTELRQQSIDEAQQKAKNAQEAMKEAEAYAAKAQMIGTIIQVIMIIIMLIVTIFTFGAAAPLAAGAVSATAGAVQAAVQFVVALVQEMAKVAMQNIVQTIVVALVTMILQLVNAGVQNEAAHKSADAKEAQNGVERARKQAEQQQQLVEEQNAIIKTIMESKNQMVDSVIKMLNAMFAANAKVQAAGMSR